VPEVTEIFWQMPELTGFSSIWNTPRLEAGDVQHIVSAAGEQYGRNCPHSIQ
jgi:hypothetical protein